MLRTSRGKHRFFNTKSQFLLQIPFEQMKARAPIVLFFCLFCFVLFFFSLLAGYHAGKEGLPTESALVTCRISASVFWRVAMTLPAV